jgi:hypothetical protein
MRGVTGLKPVSFAADMIGMDSTTRVPPETRKAMMAIASVTWEDDDETVHTARAKIEDMSVSGACIRLKIPIRAGTKVQVSWCRDEFTGMTRWCREEHGEYLVGMQRETVAVKVLARNVPFMQEARTRQADLPVARRVDAPRVRQRDEPDVSKVGTRQVNESQRKKPQELQQEAPPADPPTVPAAVPEIVQSTPPERQTAVAAYEMEQRTKFEEYWARRAEENTALQSEMERVTRQFVERMNRNLTEVQQEKEAFPKWQTAKQHEVLRISEAVTLCAQPAVCESPAERPAAASSENLVAKSA